MSSNLSRMFDAVQGQSSPLQGLNEGLIVLSSMSVPGQYRAYRAVCDAAGDLMGGTMPAQTPATGKLFLANGFAENTKRGVFVFSHQAGGIPFASGAFVGINLSEADAIAAFTFAAAGPSATFDTVSSVTQRGFINAGFPAWPIDLTGTPYSINSIAIGFYGNTSGTAADAAFVDFGGW